MRRRRHRRTFGRGLLAVCALLFVCLIAGWLRSRWVGDELRYTTLHDAGLADRWAIAHGGGDLALVRASAYLTEHSPRSGWQHVANFAFPVSNNLPYEVSGVFGYGIVHHRPASWEATLIVRYDALTLPYGLLVLVTAMPWLLLVWRRWQGRTARRLAAGLCPSCGYDLRGSPGRCPECGLVTPLPSPSPGTA